MVPDRDPLEIIRPELVSQRGVGVVAPFDFGLDRGLWRWAPDDISLYMTRLPFVPVPVTVEMAADLSDPDRVRRAAGAVARQTGVDGEPGDHVVRAARDRLADDGGRAVAGAGHRVARGLTSRVGELMTAIGILYPGYSAEDEYPTMERLLAESGRAVRLPVVHTLMREDAHRVEALLDIGGADVLAEGAASLRSIGVSAAVWACTSGSFVFGWDGASAQVDGVAAASATPASSTSFAFVNAVRHLGLMRVAIPAGRGGPVRRVPRGRRHRGGVAVCRGVVTAAEVGELGRAEVVDFVAAEAVLVPDTALHTVELLTELEDRLGKPVLTANQVSVWEGLRLVGMAEPRRGLGALFG